MKIFKLISIILILIFAAPGLSYAKITARWAHLQSLGHIYNKPGGVAYKHKRLRYFTENKLPEVYRVKTIKTDDKDREWLEIMLPARPNKQRGWALRKHFSEIYYSHELLIIKRKSMQASLIKYNKNQPKTLWRARIGVGKKQMKTPRGFFWIRERLRYNNKNSLYGPLAFGTSAYSRLSDWPGGGVIGIHGTNQPSLIPGKISHGCIRLKNKDIIRLAKYLRIGTPIRIL